MYTAEGSIPESPNRPQGIELDFPSKGEGHEGRNRGAELTASTAESKLEVGEELDMCVDERPFPTSETQNWDVEIEYEVQGILASLLEAVINDRRSSEQNNQSDAFAGPTAEDMASRQTATEVPAQSLAAALVSTTADRQILHLQARKALAFATRGLALAVDTEPKSRVPGSSKARFANTLATWKSLQKELSSMRTHQTEQLAVLQAKATECEKEAGDLQSQYTALLEKLLSEASVTETGKGIPATSMHSLKQDLLLKEHAAGIARHRVLQLKSKLHRLQDLRQEKGMQVGVHLVDFEQLKMENATLLSKIEAQGHQLSRLQQRSQAAVQVLSHVKEKLYQENSRRAELQAALEMAQDRLRGEKELMRFAKRQKEKCRMRKVKLHDMQLLESPILKENFQELLLLREAWATKVANIKEEYARVKSKGAQDSA